MTAPDRVYATDSSQHETGSNPVFRNFRNPSSGTLLFGNFPDYRLVYEHPDRKCSDMLLSQSFLELIFLNYTKVISTRWLIILRSDTFLNQELPA